MLLHALTEGEIPFVRFANGYGTEFHLTEFRFRSFPLRKFSKVPFPFVSVKTNFESSIKIPFPLMALCFRVNPYAKTLGIPSWAYGMADMRSTLPFDST